MSWLPLVEMQEGAWVLPQPASPLRCTLPTNARWAACAWRQRGTKKCRRLGLWRQWRPWWPHCPLCRAQTPQCQPDQVAPVGSETPTPASSRGSSAPTGLAGLLTMTRSAHSASAIFTYCCHLRVSVPSSSLNLRLRISSISLHHLFTQHSQVSAPHISMSSVSLGALCISLIPKHFSL